MEIMKINTSSEKTMGSEISKFTPRQDQILDKALELIRHQGLTGLTMRKVAGLMGFSEPAIYRHFTTKQDLVLGIIRRLEINLIEPMHVIAVQDGQPVVERIGDILTHHLNLIADNNALPILLFAESSVSPDERLGTAMAAVFSAYENLLVQLLEEGKNTGEISFDIEPVDLAMILMGAPTACALRLRLLHKVSQKTRRTRLVQFIKSQILSPQEVN